MDEQCITILLLAIFGAIAIIAVIASEAMSKINVCRNEKHSYPNEFGEKQVDKNA